MFLRPHSLTYRQQRRKVIRRMKWGAGVEMIGFCFIGSFDFAQAAKDRSAVPKQQKTEWLSSQTVFFSYSPDSKTSSALLRLNEEDTSAFTALYYPVIYTNLGKNQVYACTTTTRKNQVMRRSASMPIKVERCDKRIAILNRNGSISWYNSTSQSPLSDWYLTVSGEWMEF